MGGYFRESLLIMLPLFPSDTREQIEFIITQIGRPVDFYLVPTYSGCDLCSLDPVSQTSVDSFCPQCSGLFWIPIYSSFSPVAHVTYGQVDDKMWVTGGIVDNGMVTVKFMTSGWLEDAVNLTEFVVVDGREYDVVSVDVRGVQQTNRILVKLKEKER